MGLRRNARLGLAGTRALVADVESVCRVVPSRDSAPRILILTTLDLDQYVYDALGAGAGSFLLKYVGPENLISAVRQVVHGDALLAPSITRRLIEKFATPDPAATEFDTNAIASLTPRELEVLKRPRSQ